MGKIVMLVLIIGAVVIALGVADRRYAEQDLINQELQPREDLYR